MSAGLLAATFLTVYVTNDLHDGYNREAYNRLHAQFILNCLDFSHTRNSKTTFNIFVIIWTMNKWGGRTLIKSITILTNAAWCQ